MLIGDPYYSDDLFHNLFTSAASIGLPFVCSPPSDLLFTCSGVAELKELLLDGETAMLAYIYWAGALAVVSLILTAGEFNNHHTALGGVRQALSPL